MRSAAVVTLWLKQTWLALTKCEESLSKAVQAAASDRLAASVTGKRGFKKYEREAFD